MELEAASRDHLRESRLNNTGDTASLTVKKQMSRLWPRPEGYEAGPDRASDGVVRWRRVDLQRVIKERFDIDFHERYVGTILKQLGFAHMSARPRHPGQNVEIIEAFKKTSKTR